MKFKILFIVLLISLTFLVGCEKNTNEELDVALILPVTGKGAGVSQDFMYGIELAKKDWEVMKSIFIRRYSNKSKRGSDCINTIIEHKRDRFNRNNASTNITTLINNCRSK